MEMELSRGCASQLQWRDALVCALQNKDGGLMMVHVLLQSNLSDVHVRDQEGYTTLMRLASISKRVGVNQRTVKLAGAAIVRASPSVINWRRSETGSARGFDCSPLALCTPACPPACWALASLALLARWPSGALMLLPSSLCRASPTSGVCRRRLNWE